MGDYFICLQDFFQNSGRNKGICEPHDQKKPDWHHLKILNIEGLGVVFFAYPGMLMNNYAIIKFW